MSAGTKVHVRLDAPVKIGTAGDGEAKSRRERAIAKHVRRAVI
jgi:hypothetical protein